MQANPAGMIVFFFQFCAADADNIHTYIVTLSLLRRHNPMPAAISRPVFLQPYQNIQTIDHFNARTQPKDRYIN